MIKYKENTFGEMMKWNVWTGEPRMNFLQNMLINEKIINPNIPSIEVLPIPVTRDGEHITGSKILLKDFFSNLPKNSLVFCGRKDFIPNNVKINNKIYDYSDNELFLLKNAELTAHGAMKILYENLQKPVNKAKILITGFGRIGKNLTKMLTSLEAEVYVLGNKVEDFFWINKTGAIALSSLENFNICLDFVINTVPKMIFNEKNTKNFDKNTVFLEVASNPGIDKSLCTNFKHILALGIPGKFFPQYAAEIIKESIINIINSGV